MNKDTLTTLLEEVQVKLDAVKAEVAKEEPAA